MKKRQLCLDPCWMLAKRRPLAERFWMRVRKGERCWLWTGTLNGKGYGQIGRGGSGTGMALAHRVSWEIHRGPIPQGLFVLHRCDTPACVRPDHLFLGTNHDNVRDMISKGRNSVPPHRRGERHHAAKLSAREVLEIRRRRASGEKMVPLAHAFGVSRSTIGLVCSGKIWTHLHPEAA